jgi:hypothetical protein
MRSQACFRARRPSGGERVDEPQALPAGRGIVVGAHLGQRPEAAVVSASPMNATLPNTVPSMSRTGWPIDATHWAAHADCNERRS